MLQQTRCPRQQNLRYGTNVANRYVQFVNFPIFASDDGSFHVHNVESIVSEYTPENFDYMGEGLSTRYFRLGDAHQCAMCTFSYISSWINVVLHLSPLLQEYDLG